MEVFRSFAYSVIPLYQAVVYKLFKKILGINFMALRKRVELRTVSEIDFIDTLDYVRPVRSTIEPFAIEKNVDDIENFNATQRQLPLKRAFLSEIYRKDILEIITVVNESNYGVLSTYNYSEAAANISLMAIRQRAEVPDYKDSSDTLDKLKYYLEHIQRYPEYYFFLTNNHILNNARALLLGGAVLEDSGYLHAGMKLLEYGFVVFDKKGVFRERSTHYHLLILSWLKDAETALRSVRHERAVELLNKLLIYIDRNIEIARYLLSYTEYAFPLVGDISPDEPPVITRSKIENLIGGNHLVPVINKKKWMRQGSWCFFFNDNWSALACIGNVSRENFPTHGHDDWGSLILAKNGQEVLIDLGLSSYGKSVESNHQRNRKFHNLAYSEGLERKKEVFKHWRKTYRENIIGEGCVEFIEKGSNFCWHRTINVLDSEICIVDVVHSDQAVGVRYNFSKNWYDKHLNNIILDVSQEDSCPPDYSKRKEYVNRSVEYSENELAIAIVINLPNPKSTTVSLRIL